MQARALTDLGRYEDAAAAYRRAGEEGRAVEVEAIAAAIEHNRDVEAEDEKCRGSWAEIARLREENRDIEGTAAWKEIDRRAERVEVACGPEPPAAMAR